MFNVACHRSNPTPAIDLTQFLGKSLFRPPASSSTLAVVSWTATSQGTILPLPLPAALEISGGGGQLNDEPMLINYAFSIFNGGSSLSLGASASTPGLELRVEAVSISIGKADTNANGM